MYFKVNNCTWYCITIAACLYHVFCPDGCYHFGDNVEVKGDVFKYTGGQDSDAGLIKVLKQMSSSHNYFECEITSGGKQPATGVGIGSFTYPLNRMPGWESNGLGYHSDDGKLYRSNKLRFSLSSYGPVYVGDNVDFSFDLKQGSSIRFFLTINGKRNEMRFLGSSYGLKYGPICAVGDRMGCGVEFEGAARDSVNVFFTVNGKVVGNLIHFKIPDDGLYPLIGMCNEGDQVKYLGQWQHHPHIEVNETKTKVITRRCDTRYIRSEPSSKVRKSYIVHILHL